MNKKYFIFYYTYNNDICKGWGDIAIGYVNLFPSRKDIERMIIESDLELYKELNITEKNIAITGFNRISKSEYYLWINEN